MSDEIVINDDLAIAAWEVTFSFSPSSGPGGQHANRSATRVTLFFDVANSPSLDERQRRLLSKRLANRLDQDGILQLTVQDTRSQHQNRELAVERFQELLARGLKKRKRRRPTRVPRSVQEKRLQKKKRRGQLKRNRGRDWRDWE